MHVAAICYACTLCWLLKTTAEKEVSDWLCTWVWVSGLPYPVWRLWQQTYGLVSIQQRPQVPSCSSTQTQVHALPFMQKEGMMVIICLYTHSVGLAMKLLLQSYLVGRPADSKFGSYLGPKASLYPNSPQISLCKKKIPHHIKISAYIRSTKYRWNQKLIAQFCCTLRDEYFKSN
jgi:hypothetical protein